MIMSEAVIVVKGIKKDAKYFQDQGGDKVRKVGLHSEWMEKNNIWRSEKPFYEKEGDQRTIESVQEEACCFSVMYSNGWIGHLQHANKNLVHPKIPLRHNMSPGWDYLSQSRVMGSVGKQLILKWIRCYLFLNISQPID